MFYNFIFYTSTYISTGAKIHILLQVPITTNPLLVTSTNHTIPYRQTETQGDGHEASVRVLFDPELTHVTYAYVVLFITFYTAICM